MNYKINELWEHVEIHGYTSEWSTFLLRLAEEGASLTKDEENILDYELDQARQAFNGELA